MNYPSMLYPDGDVTKAWAIANNEEDEIALREQGYRVGFEPAEVKPAAVAKQFKDAAAKVEAGAASELEAARAEAKAMGLTFHHKTGIATIRAAIDAKKIEG